MSNQQIVEVFFRRRWPDGFRCPFCAFPEFYLISTRSLPLYECRHCRRQTSVTSGTIMHKTRTPLAKWAAAVEALSSSSGLNACRLAEAIGVTRKTACTMLRKFRQAIAEAEESRKLEGVVYGSLFALAPKYFWVFLPDRRYRKERVVSLCAAFDASGAPIALKLHTAEERDLKPGTKEATTDGIRRMLARAARAGAAATWLSGWKKCPEALNEGFRGARRWLNLTFHGLRTKYLQSYLHEYCFRWNLAARGASAREEWFALCTAGIPRVG